MKLKGKEILANILAKSIVKDKAKVYITRKYVNSCIDYENGSLPSVCLNLGYTDADETFLDNVKEEHGFKRAYDFSPILWTILHEIGHIKTDFNKYSEEEKFATAFIEFALDNAEDEEEYDKARKLHYRVKSEILATDWAINFIKRHYLLSYIMNYLLKQKARHYRKWSRAFYIPTQTFNV